MAEPRYIWVTFVSLHGQRFSCGVEVEMRTDDIVCGLIEHGFLAPHSREIRGYAFRTERSFRWVHGNDPAAAEKWLYDGAMVAVNPRYAAE